VPRRPGRAAEQRNGRSGFNPVDMKFIDEALKELLAN
jgi:hypothetical protein